MQTMATWPLNWVSAALQEMGSMRLAAGNGADAGVRQLLPQAVLQLADMHANRVATAGVQMAARLAWPARSSQRRSQAAPPGAELPVLHGCSVPDATVCPWLLTVVPLNSHDPFASSISLLLHPSVYLLP